MVIAIISLLVAILLPALAAARNAAKVTACASQLRQMGIGLIAYTTDHNGILPTRKKWPHLNLLNPLTMYSPDPADHKSGFYQEGYIQDKRLFYCPNNEPTFNASNHPYVVKNNWGVSWSTNGWPHTYSSYMYMAGNEQMLVGIPSATRVYNTQHPVDQLRLMQDYSYYTSGGNYFFNHPGRTKADSFSGLSGSNVVFLDGHVTWLSKNEMDLNKLDVIGSSHYVY